MFHVVFRCLFHYQTKYVMLIQNGWYFVIRDTFTVIRLLLYLFLNIDVTCRQWTWQQYWQHKEFLDEEGKNRVRQQVNLASIRTITWLQCYLNALFPTPYQMVFPSVCAVFLNLSSTISTFMGIHPTQILGSCRLIGKLCQHI